MAKLLVQESNGAREFELVDVEVNIGRELDNTLRLSDPSISRHHAVIRQTASGYEIQDLGSSNGVLLNGSRVDAAPLRDGDRITLGQMQLTFVSPRPVAPEVNPLGTVRMNLDDMAKMQASAAPEAPDATVETPVPVPAPIPVPIPIPIPIPAPMPPPPPPAPRAQNPFPPEASGPNPAPAFLQQYLPPIPDDAQPIWVTGFIERGEFGERFLAYLIDGLVGLGFVVVFWLFFFVLGLLTHGVGACFGCALYPFVGLAYLGFTLWCMVTFRATIGKKVMKLRVVPEDNPMGNIDWGMAILRVLGHIVSGMVCYLPYLLIFTAERKGLQDMFSRSIVIKVDR